MTETTPAPLVTSRLWRFVLLVNHSAYFPRLVEGAALALGKPFSREMLAHVASRPDVVDAIRVTTADVGPAAVDTVIERLVVDNGKAVDDIILAAVQSYTPPA